jgi:hypothetical protein
MASKIKQAPFICLREEDTTEPIIMQCAYARQVWHICFRRCDLLIQQPQSDSAWEAWWLSARKHVLKRDGRKFDSMIILTAWMLWKQRNARVFGNTREQCSELQLADCVRDEFRGLGSSYGWSKRETTP